MRMILGWLRRRKRQREELRRLVRLAREEAERVERRERISRLVPCFGGPELPVCPGCPHYSTCRYIRRQARRSVGKGLNRGG